jgi:DNA repair exonuclease SbcCD ATPase subunit
MDLYNFINANTDAIERFIMPRPEKETTASSSEDTENASPQQAEVNSDTLESLRSERDKLIAERDRLIGEADSLRARMVALEEELTRLKKGSSEFSSLLQSLRSGKEELISRIKDLQEQAQTLEQEKETLQGQLAVTVSERDRSLQEAEQGLISKNAEIQQLRTEMAALQARLNQSETSLQEAEQSISGKNFEIDQLVANNTALQETINDCEERIKNLNYEKETILSDLERLRKDFSAYLQKTKMAFAVICIAALIAVAGLFVFFSKRDIPEQRSNQPDAPKAASTETPPTLQDAAPKAKEEDIKTQEMPKQPEKGGKILEPARPKDAEKSKSADSAKNQPKKKIDSVAPMPLKEMSLRLSNMKIELSPLQKGDSKPLPPSMEYKAEQGKSYYLISISSNRGALSSEFIKSPYIDFMDSKNERASQKGAVKVLQISKKRIGKSGAVSSIDCLVSLSNDFQPTGLIMKHPTNKIIKMLIL